MRWPSQTYTLAFDAAGGIALRADIKIAGLKHWLWRAVDQTGMVLDVLVQSRRDKGAAKRLLRKLLKRQCRTPRVIIADKLASYGVAQKEIMPGVEYRQHKGLNNRAENSHPDFYTAAPRDQDGRAKVILSSMTAFGPIGT